MELTTAQIESRIQSALFPRGQPFHRGSSFLRSTGSLQLHDVRDDDITGDCSRNRRTALTQATMWTGEDAHRVFGGGIPTTRTRRNMIPSAPNLRISRFAAEPSDETELGFRNQRKLVGLDGLRWLPLRHLHLDQRR
jgi:hypothetical protein